MVLNSMRLHAQLERALMVSVGLQCAVGAQARRRPGLCCIVASSEL